MLSETLKNAFGILEVAWLNGDVAMLEVVENATQKKVAMLCVVQYLEGEYVLTPLARMLEGNPYDDYTPPHAPPELKLDERPAPRPAREGVIYAFDIKHKTNTGFTGTESFKVTEDNALKLRNFLNHLPLLPHDTKLTKPKK